MNVLSGVLAHTVHFLKQGYLEIESKSEVRVDTVGI